MSVNETATPRPRQFLADLTQAMSATAETARQSTIVACRSDAHAYTERLRARTDDELAALRQAAEADVGVVREWSRAEMDRTRLEVEERIALRRRQLEAELQEYASAVEVELQRVDDQVEAFGADLETFFERLMEDPDPTSFAMMAARMPNPPALEEPDPAAIVQELRAASDPGAVAEAGSADRSETLPDRWWMESPASIAARVRSIAGPSQTA